MATKAKPTNGATETVEKMVSQSTEAMKDSFEKTMSSFDKFNAFSKENVEAVMQSANATTKGLEAINSEALAFSRQSVEDGVAAAKAIMGAKSVQEFVELNSEFSKSAFDQYVGQMTKLGDMFTSLAKDASEPLNGRVNAFVEIVKTARPAA